jgi:hypothetical protein
VSWNNDVFGSVFKQIRQLRNELEEERSTSLYRDRLRKRMLMHKLSDLIEKEDIMQKQRSRIDWLKAGDRNTQFFQAKASNCQRTNCIFALKRVDGEIITEPKAWRNWLFSSIRICSKPKTTFNLI